MPVEGAWADHLGGRILPEARGPLSAEWRALLAGESPAGIGAKAGAGLAPQERLLQPMMYGALMENAHNGGAHRPLRPWYRCTHAGVLLHASFLAAAAAEKAASSHHSRARIALPSSVSLEGPIANSKSPWLASWRALSAMYSSIIPSNKGKKPALRRAVERRVPAGPAPGVLCDHVRRARGRPRAPARHEGARHVGLGGVPVEPDLA